MAVNSNHSLNGFIHAWMAHLTNCWSEDNQDLTLPLQWTFVC